MSAEFPSLADIVRKHRLVTLMDGRVFTGYICDCGWTSPEEHCTRTDHPEHVDEMWSKVCTVATVEQLNALPRGTVVESNSGTIAAYYGDRRGVVFGDERTFNWQSLALPVVVLWHPDWSRK